LARGVRTTSSAETRLGAVVVASDDSLTSAVVRGSLAGLGLAVGEITANETPAWLGERDVAAVIADSELSDETLTALCGLLNDPNRPMPKLLVLVKRGAEPEPSPLGALADDELAKPFSGLQLAVALRRLLGRTAVLA
jgi:two-component system, OmpR family, response regulator